MDEQTYPPEAWQRAGRAVKRRRLDLGLTQPELAAGGPSVSVISKIETARANHYEDRVLYRLEDALRWTRGSFERLLEGGEPEITEPDGVGRTPPLSQPNDLSEAPAGVAEDPFLRHIWTYPGTDASDDVREAAIRGAELARKLERQHEIARNDQSAGRSA